MGQRGPGAKPIKKREWVNPVKKVGKVGRPIMQPWDAPGLTRAGRVIAFLETLPVTSGNLAGTLFKVRDWQRRDIIEPLYATDETGRRFVREGFISMPRKQGKTGIVAGLSLCHLCGPESIERGQIVSCASDKDQAGIIFAEMLAIIDRVKWMSNRVMIQNFKKAFEDAETGTTYKALSSESKTKHGLSLSFWIYDELAQAPNRKLYDVVSTATAAWDEPLGIVMSTQSEDPRHVMSELYDDGEQIQSGVIEDRSKHACIYSAPMDSDPWSEATWYACNPALGDFRSLEEMQSFARKAQRMPGLEQTFRLLYLNQRVSGEVRFVPRALWDACGESVKAFNIESLKGLPCVGALDLSGSGKNDLTSLVLLFTVDEKLKVLPFYWAAADGLEAAEKRDRVPYRQWADEGFLLTTPGRILDYGFIANKIAELSSQYDIRFVGVDPWNIERMIKAIEDIGCDLSMVKHGQNIQDMDPAVKALEDAILSGTLRHNRNPILTWNMDNVMVIQDSNGNRKFDKRKAAGRIDGAVALAMGANLSESFEPEPVGSYASTLI